MKAKREPADRLQPIAQIQPMARGKLCPLRAGTDDNHQTWENGRNVVRYVARNRVANLQQAIAGYQQHLKLTQAYADEIIRRTRQAHPPFARNQPKTKQPPGNQKFRCVCPGAEPSPGRRSNKLKTHLRESTPRTRQG